MLHDLRKNQPQKKFFPTMNEDNKPQEKHRLNIQDAIRAYNLKRPKDTPKMTAEKLAAIVFENLSPKQGAYKLSRTNHGFTDGGYLRVCEIKAIAKALNTDFNTLFK